MKTNYYTLFFQVGITKTLKYTDTHNKPFNKPITMNNQTNTQQDDLENNLCDDNDYYVHSHNNGTIKDYTNYKTIDIFSILYQLLWITLIGIFTFCLLHYYISIQYEEYKSVSKSDPSNLLLTEIFMLLCQFCISYNTLIIKLDRYGKKYSKKSWEGVMVFNNKNYGMFKTLTFCILQISTMTLAPIFVPFASNNCHGYSHAACVFVRFISFFGIAMIICYGLLVVLTMTSTIFGGKSGVKKLRTKYILYRKLFDLSMFGIFQLYDDTCVICSANETYGTGPYVKLCCNHRFHRDCVDNWRQRNDKCPICNQVVLNNSNSGDHGFDSDL